MKHQDINVRINVNRFCHKVSSKPYGGYCIYLYAWIGSGGKWEKTVNSFTTWPCLTIRRDRHDIFPISKGWCVEGRNMPELRQGNGENKTNSIRLPFYLMRVFYWTRLSKWIRMDNSLISSYKLAAFFFFQK